MALLWLAHGFSDWISTAGLGLLEMVIPRRSTTYLYSVHTCLFSHTECSEALNVQPTLTIFPTGTLLSPVV